MIGKWLDKHLVAFIWIGIIVAIIGIIIEGEVSAHQELRNDIPVVPHALSYCFMRYDSNDDGGKDTYLECNMTEGFTQEQLRTMREHLEEYASKETNKN